MRLRIAALTLALGLGFVGVACADEGNWFTRWFTSGAEKKDKLEIAKLEAERAKMPPAASALRAKQAAADKERRDAVCLKLRDLALASGDEAMVRKVEQLEQRVWDLYVASTNLRNVPVADASKKGAR